MSEKDLRDIIAQVLTEMNVSDGATASAVEAAVAEKPPHRMALKLRTAVGTM